MIQGIYDPALVVVSIGISMFASYTALTVANRVAGTTGRARTAWLAGGSLAMGTGIWSMHFVGMLAFSVPGMPMVYDVPLLILSVLVAIIASAIALYVVTYQRVHGAALGGAGMAMAAAICGMHYIGIAGMRMNARIVWEWSLVIASIAIAIAASYAALWLAMRLRHGSPRQFIPAAVVMGIAISGMHYTAMAAMSFVPVQEQMTIRDEDLLVTSGLATAVSLSTLLVLSIALISSVAQRELERQAMRADDHARLFHAADRRAAEEEALRRATEELSDAFDVVHVLERITRSAREATAADGALVERISDDGTTVTIAAADGSGEALVGSRLPYAGSYAEQVAERSQPLVLSGSGEPAESVIAIQLGEESVRIGALVLIRSRERDPFRDEDVRRALTFAHLSLLAFRRIGLLQEAEQRRQQVELAGRVAGLGRLASTMAHEFNNVLMSIQAFNDATRRVGTFEQYLKSAPEIDRAIQRGRRITEAVLRLARTAAVTLKPIDLEELLALLETDLASLVPREIKVAIECEPRLYVWGDPSHLEQVFVNLAFNSRDAMPDGGLFAITAQRDRAGVIRLTVTDTGSGVSSDEQKKIFEPLYTTKKEGTGLGLAIVHEIVRSHKGTIAVTSELGKGTRFDITLLEAPPPDTSAAAGAEVVATRVKRVLLVEDDDAVASGLTLLMQLSGIEVKHVALGREALPAIDSFRPDVTLLDIGLPDLDGVAVYEQIAVYVPQMPVIFATGHADESRLSTVARSPHVAFLRKPFESDELFATMERVRSAQSS
jgi:NO-binding membrane sensor protein with MHYT domain/signal transduction histidine kinase/ActR/RegA family two-component response regulator